MAEATYVPGQYKRGSRLPKKSDFGIEPAPCAETPDVPWTWEEDGMTVISEHRPFGSRMS